VPHYREAGLPELVPTEQQGPPPAHRFGGGVHYCLGAALARVEMQEALALAAPALRDLALDAEPTWRDPAGLLGSRSLPLRRST
jgi:hypothetical protein